MCSPLAPNASQLGIKGVPRCRYCANWYLRVGPSLGPTWNRFVHSHKDSFSVLFVFSMRTRVTEQNSVYLLSNVCVIIPVSWVAFAIVGEVLWCCLVVHVCCVVLWTHTLPLSLRYSVSGERNMWDAPSYWQQPNKCSTPEGTTWHLSHVEIKGLALPLDFGEHSLVGSSFRTRFSSFRQWIGGFA